MFRRQPSFRARSARRAPIPACFPSTTTNPGQRTPPWCGICPSFSIASRRSRSVLQKRRKRMADAMDIAAVLEHLPHRFPFLLVDRIKTIELGRRIVALKNVTMNEPFFQGHFPQRPIMPGVLILESMAQAAGILVFRTQGNKPDANSAYYLAGIDKARFKRPVVPGDQLELEVNLERGVRGVWKFSCTARVEGAIVCEAEMLCSVRKTAQS